jgi:CRISPR-associated endonuclease Csn1
MKRILGLDLGTTSIGWAFIAHDFEKKEGEIKGLGSRIIPMDAATISDFEKGNTISQTAERTKFRSTRRLYQRNVLRRERLHRVLNVLGFLPEHYAKNIDYEYHPGQFKNGLEPKINYRPSNTNGYEFIFKESFNEMVKEFKSCGHNVKIPHDWTIYYLRKKALTEKISKEELAWVILNFNQKRGYYQLRGEEEENEKERNKTEEFYSLKITGVKETDEKNTKGTWYNINLENGWVYRRQSKQSLNSWVGSKKDFIVTTHTEDDGTPKKDKEGNIRRNFRAVDSENDWIAIKKKTEQDIQNTEKTVSEYIFDTLLENPNQKIRGKLVRTIERKFYKDELKRILDNQAKFHPEFHDRILYMDCVEELYPKNEAHKENIKDKNFVYLFLEDIIFYQRPLKSKKSSIANCQYETRTFKKQFIATENGKTIKKESVVTEHLKGISKSNPLFQEFRLWQFLRNLRIYKHEAEIDGKPEIDVNVTNSFLPDEDSWVGLFDYLNSVKEINQNQLLEYFVNKSLLTKRDKNNYRWNYVEDKKYPCNDTKTQLTSRLKKVQGIDAEIFLTKEVEYHLWHIIYSIRDKKEFEKALKTFAKKHKIDVESFFEQFKNLPPFKNDYAAYSSKAIKKLLPLMRQGKYWDEEKIPAKIIERGNAIFERLKSIDFDSEKIDDNVADDDIPKPILKSFVKKGNENFYRGLNTYQACYIIYNRHSEISDLMQWKRPDDISNYLAEFKQHSLHNPIVEKIVTETLRVVKDIWEYYGNGAERFFDEIHVELGRDLKNPANIRSEISGKIAENENTNQRIREILLELKNDSGIHGEVRPWSPSHQEILKIYEEGVYQNPNASYESLSLDDVEKIRKNSSPSKSEITKYKLWLEQGYVSPYTGKIIPLSKLFTPNYEIEHIIPQSRYFDDSLSNKIICESEINALKDRRTAYEFLKDENGRIIELAGGKTVRLFTLKEYETHCNDYFKKNRTKLKKLLSEDIPESFIERQLNDSRYISKLVKGLLSNLLREYNEQEVTSKNLVPVSGAITSMLKNDWGLNDKWNDLIAPRFQRMNELTQSNDYGFWDEKIKAFRPTVPHSIAKGFSKKRIDHRHHALDALVVACTTKDHVNYITSLNTQRNNYSLVNKLRQVREKQYMDKRTGELKTRKVPEDYLLPWNSFPKDAQDCLGKTVISFKQNLRVINKANNKTWQWKARNGKLKKEQVPQTKGDNWAIRKPMHKDTVSGKVKVRIKKEVSFVNGIKTWENLVDKKLKRIIRKLKSEGKNDKALNQYFRNNPYMIDIKAVKEVEVYVYTQNATASRLEISDKFSRKHIDSVTDSGIRKILEKHLENYKDEKGNERFDLAFNPEGLTELNCNLTQLNDGKKHKPIYRVRIYEEGNKFRVGQTGNKKKKYVEAAKGTNLFFAVYWNEKKQKREYETISLIDVIEYQKWRATLPKEEQKITPIIPVNPENGKFLFSLSPNDLVYVPTEEDLINPGMFRFENLTPEQSSRIYKMLSSTGNECHFVQNHVASLIKSYDAKSKIGEFGSLNKMETDIHGTRIKECCWKLEFDRLGNIIKVYQ